MRLFNMTLYSHEGTGYLNKRSIIRKYYLLLITEIMHTMNLFYTHDAIKF